MKVLKCMKTISPLKWDGTVASPQMIMMKKYQILLCQLFFILRLGVLSKQNFS
jgi:hypothetical protein